jgi:hypothetical protein
MDEIVSTQLLTIKLNDLQDKASQLNFKTYGSKKIIFNRIKDHYKRDDLKPNDLFIIDATLSTTVSSSPGHIYKFISN